MQSDNPQKVFKIHPSLEQVHHKNGVLEGTHISYITRTNPLPKLLEDALLEGFDRYVFEYTSDMKNKKIDINEVFLSRFGTSGRKLAIEIGFGDGENSFKIAKANPNINYLAFDVYLRGLAEYIQRLNADPLDNVLLSRYDAEDFISHSIFEDSVDFFNIFFPDPWHKRKHKKRRIINPKFALVLAGCLKKGGIIHCATDIEEYAVQMHDVFSSTQGLKNPYGDKNFAPNMIDRFLTSFEAKGAQEGRGSFDIIYQKI